MTQAGAHSIRRLISAILFLTAGTFIAINIGVFNSSTLATIDTILAIAWASSWCLTAAHNLYYRAVIAKRAVQNPTGSPVMNDRILGLRRSTHSYIKSSLITTTATSALVMDLYRIRNPNPTREFRVAGSLIWLGVGSFEIFLAARHERKQENHPNHSIKPCGIKPSVYHFIHDVAYLSAGLMYAAGVWLDGTNSPLTNASDNAWIIPIPNCCWLLAAINEVSRTLQVLIEECQKTNNAIEDGDTLDEICVDAPPSLTEKKLPEELSPSGEINVQMKH